MVDTIIAKVVETVLGNKAAAITLGAVAAAGLLYLMAYNIGYTDRGKKELELRERAIAEAVQEEADRQEAQREAAQDAADRLSRENILLRDLYNETLIIGSKPCLDADQFNRLFPLREGDSG